MRAKQCEPLNVSPFRHGAWRCLLLANWPYTLLVGFQKQSGRRDGRIRMQARRRERTLQNGEGCTPLAHTLASRARSYSRAS